MKRQEIGIGFTQDYEMKKKTVFATKLLVCFFFITGVCNMQAQNPIINYVTFNADNNVVVNWGFGSDPTPAESLTIFRRNGNQAENDRILDLVFDDFGAYEVTPGFYEYEDNSFETSPPVNFYSYSISTYDSSGVTIEPSSSYHATIFLSGITQGDYCESSIELTWINYQVFRHAGSGFDPLPVPFDRLRIQKSTDGGINYQTIDEFDFPGQLQTSYTVDGLSPDTYHFRIQAFQSSSPNYTSSSNTRSTVFNPPQITNIEIISIDVVDNREIEINWDATGDTNDFRYVFFRSDNASDGFEPIETLIQIQPFIDQDVEIGEGPWFYKIESYLIQNECAIPSTSTHNDFSSIFLTASIDLSANRIDFDWQHTFPTHIDFIYQLQRLDGSENWQDVPNTVFGGFNQGYFNYNQGDLAGSVVLRLVANRTDQPNVFVHSNHTIISIEPQVFIPNAFRPSSADSRNTTFKPIIPGYNPSQYQLIVFDRWGLKIFESSDKEIGWDGTVNGTNAQPGAYSYLLRFSGLEDETIEKRGMVVLVN